MLVYLNDLVASTGSMHFSAEKSELNRSALTEQFMNKVIPTIYYAKPPNKVSAAIITKKNNTFLFTSFIMQVAS
jgi:hypothetical protein